MKLTIAATALVVMLAGCDYGAKLTGTTSDGETFTGIANATGMWDRSGTINLVGNRGLSCVGTYVFEGMAGSTGKATFNCSNGETGEARLQGQNSGVGEGSIGARRINFRWGSVSG